MLVLANILAAGVYLCLLGWLLGHMTLKAPGLIMALGALCVALYVAARALERASPRDPHRGRPT